jgi:glutamate-1-semialdehyde aminotransferase
VEDYLLALCCTCRNNGLFSPLGPVYQAGTLSENFGHGRRISHVEALNANRKFFTRLAEKTAYLAAGIIKYLQQRWLLP